MKSVIVLIVCMLVAIMIPFIYPLNLLLPIYIMGIFIYSKLVNVERIIINKYEPKKNYLEE